jgi:hypothetical protein
MIRTFHGKALLRLLVLLLACVYTVGRGAAVDDPAADAAVQAALRAALLGKPDDVRKAARLQRIEEQKRTDGNSPTLAENIESLAVATERPLPTLSDKRHRLSDYGSDQMTKNLDRLLRRVEPRQRFLEARKDARYEGTRRFFNGVIVPLSALARGQFFALFTLPFEAADAIIVGSQFLTPEERRQLYLARGAAAHPSNDATVRDAKKLLEDDTYFRRKLASLQAKQNAERARDEGRDKAAFFWYGKEMELQRWNKPRRSSHRDLLAEYAREESSRDRSRTVADGDGLFFSPDEFAAYSGVLRLFLLDANGTDFSQAAQSFRADFPTSSAIDDLDAAEAARAAHNGETLLARVQLEEMAAKVEESPWKERARAALRRVEFNPAGDLQRAKNRIDDRFLAFLLRGEDPDVFDRALTPEEARIRRAAWVERARGLFITDTISRALFLPFLDPFPEPELADAAARIDAAFFDSAEGRGWLRRVMTAQRIEKRFEAAKQSADRLGDAPAVVAMDRRAARRLEKLAGESNRPREAVAIYERLLNAYPAYSKRQRVERDLLDVRAKAMAQAIITRDELVAYPELWRRRGLALSPTLLDGSKANGEISKEGVCVLGYDAYSYVDRGTGRRVEIPLAPADRELVLREYEPRRRSVALDVELRKPLPRKKIPVAMEAGAFPGFDVSPSLVPLQPDSEDRKLYD